MVVGKTIVWAGLALAGTAAMGSGLLSQETGSQQKSTIPDAPKPQTLPSLKTITPVSTIPDAPLPSNASTSSTASGDQTAVPSSLPATQKQQAPPDEDPNDPGPQINPADYRAGRIVVPVSFVEIPFTVKDSRNQLVPGITSRDVRVYENGLRQSPKLFTSDPSPLSVALVIDQSVTPDTMAKINNSLSALQGAFTPYDEVAIFTYNNGVRKQTTFTAAQSARLGVILERSKAPGREVNMYMGTGLDQTLVKNNQIVDPNTTPVRGQTSLYQNQEKEYHTLNDAILAAAVETSRAGKGRRRVVYVISDGKEYGSKASQKEVLKYLQSNKVAVYATLVGDSSIPGMGFLDRIHLPFTMRDDVLPRYAALTGGQCDPEFRQKGIETSFAKISEEVRTQYTIGYYSHEPMIDGKYRSVEVRVMRPNLTVISKTGYYPTASDTTPTPVTPSAVP